jgi:hypothetical protein
MRRTAAFQGKADMLPFTPARANFRLIDSIAENEFSAMFGRLWIVRKFPMVFSDQDGLLHRTLRPISCALATGNNITPTPLKYTGDSS